MWRAALPCRHVGLALLGSILATAWCSAPRRRASAAASAAPAGQVWALALPDSVKTVEQKQLRLARGPRRHHDRRLQAHAGVLQRLAASAKRSGLVVIAPRQVAPEEGVQVRAARS